MMIWNEHSHPAADGRIVECVLLGLIFVSSLAGELLERYLFFAAVAALRMPGSLRT